MKFPELVSSLAVCLQLSRTSFGFIPNIGSRSTIRINQATAEDTNDLSIVSNRLTVGLQKMDRIMSPNFFDDCDNSLKQLNSQIVKSVQVSQSPIHGAGKGLFATKNIKAGSIVGFYPAHTLGLEIGGTELFVANQMSDKAYFEENPPGGSSYLHATDQPIFNRPSLLAELGPDLKDSPLYLDVNPTREISPAWVSQYINDGAIMLDNSEAGVSEYYSASKAKKNCVHIPFGPSPIMATVATKKIKKGEELLTSYGCVYWVGVLFDSQEGAAMTGQIQEQIKESAQDLFAAMNSVSTRYKNHMDALQAVFDEL